MAKKLSIEEIQKRFTVTPMQDCAINKCTRWKCLACLKVFTRKYYLIRKRGGCTSCMAEARANRAEIAKLKRRKRLLQETLQQLRNRFDGKIKLRVSTFINKESQAQFKCVCGHTWSAFVKSTLTMKYGCNACAARETAHAMNAKRLEASSKKLSKLGFKVLDTKLPLGAPRNTKIRVKCLKCGHISKTRLASLHSRRCCRRCLHGGNHFNKKHIAIFGKIFKVMGYEHFAIKWIAEHTNYDIKHIDSEDLPVFRYKEDKKYRIYIPDIQAGRNIVEVKSAYTLGLGNDKMFKNVQLKARSVVDNGYVFKLMLFTPEGEKLRIPRNWSSLSRLDMIRALNKLNNHTDFTRFAGYPQE